MIHKLRLYHNNCHKKTGKTYLVASLVLGRSDGVRVRHDEVFVARDVDYALRVDQTERRLIDGRRGGGLAAVGEGRGQPRRAQVRRLLLLLLLLLPLMRLLLEGLRLRLAFLLNSGQIF